MRAASRGYVGAVIPDVCDVVVIGAGIGGLTSGALLAKAGLRVCVLESAEVPGGYLAGFRRRGFAFDTAIHWLNQCGPRGAVRRVLSIVGPGAPETPTLRRVRRVRGDSFDHLLTHEPDTLRDRLVADHPAEAAAIVRYFAAAAALGRALDGFADHLRIGATMSFSEKLAHALGTAALGLRHLLPYFRWSTEDAFARLFPAPSLARIYCSEERLVSCLFPLAWAYNDDYQAPPRGGARELPRFLARAIRAWGGALVSSAHVDRIHVESGRARGVSFVVGRGRTRRALRADYVLAACDSESVYERMLPHGAVDPAWRAKLRDADIGDSHVTVFLGLDRPAEELGLDDQLTMLTRDDVSRRDHNAGDPTRAAITVLAASARDPSVAPPGKGTVRLTVSAPMAYGDRWKTRDGLVRGPEYQAFKGAYAEVLVERVARALSPRLREHVEVREVATPITHHRYTWNRDGSIVGTKPTARNIWNGVAHYRTPIENVILSGQWAELGGGVPIAVKAGTNAALLVLMRERREAFAQLVAALDGERPPGELDPAYLQPLPEPR